jgi:hypothetical protein
LKAISIKQPWLDLILNGKKDIETRTYNTEYRGYLFLHAPKGKDALMMKAILESEPGYKPVTGAIIGIAKLVAVMPYETEEAFMHHYSRHWCNEDYYDDETESYGFVMKNVMRLQYPFFCTGRTKIFNVQDKDLWLYLLEIL